MPGASCGPSSRCRACGSTRRETRDERGDPAPARPRARPRGPGGRVGGLVGGARPSRRGGGRGPGRGGRGARHGGPPGRGPGGGGGPRGAAGAARGRSVGPPPRPAGLLQIRRTAPIYRRVRAVSDTGVRAPDGADAATNPKAIRRLAASGWTAGIVIACGLMIPAPPTPQLGAAGWAAGIGIQAVSLLARLACARNRTVSPRRLLAITWLLPVDIAAMQWLAGGWAAPYHELLLLSLILGSASMSMRRFAPIAIAVAAPALAPAVYAPDPDAPVGVVPGLVVWLFVSPPLALSMPPV